MVLQDSCILSIECDVCDSSLSGKEFRVANMVHSWGSRPLQQQIHSREDKDGKVCWWNSLAKAFSQLEIASYWDVINYETWYWWHHIWGLRFRFAKFKTCQIKKYGLLAENTKSNARQIFLLYSTSRTEWYCFHRSTHFQPNCLQTGKQRLPGYPQVRVRTCYRSAVATWTCHYDVITLHGTNCFPYQECNKWQLHWVAGPYSDFVDTLADSICIHQLVPKTHSKAVCKMYRLQCMSRSN